MEGAVMKKVVVMHFLVVLLLASTWGFAEAVEALKPYDTFEVGPINPDKWVGFQSGSEVREAARTIIQDPEGRHLRIFDRSYGETASDAGTSFGGFAFAFRNPSTITAIGATVQVRNIKSTGCPSNPAPTLATADIFGNFFNVGTPVPGSRVGDVFAVVEVVRLSNSTDPPGVLRVDAVVIQCLDVDCSNRTLLSFTPLGTVTTGQWVRLLMQWDQANHQFIFQRGRQTPVIVPYAVSDTAEPGFQLKDLEVIQFVANCTAAPRPVGMVDSLFDNVFVNQTAIP
jgi:hypothetical protein